MQAVHRQATSGCCHAGLSVVHMLEQSQRHQICRLPPCLAALRGAASRENSFISGTHRHNSSKEVWDTRLGILVGQRISGPERCQRMLWQQAWQRLSPPSSLLKLLPDAAAVVGAARIIWWLADTPEAAQE